MKISIITATYNSSAPMAGCLASVNNHSRQVNHAGQAYKNIEHIIIDGASRGQRSDFRLLTSDFRLLTKQTLPPQKRAQRLDLSCHRLDATASHAVPPQRSV